MKKGLIIISIYLFLLSCSKQQDVVNYYRVYSSKKEVVAYYEIKSHNAKEKRVDSIKRYDLKGKLEESYQEYYFFNENEIKEIFSFEKEDIVFRKYSLKDDKCFTSSTTSQPIEICYKQTINYENNKDGYLFVEKSLQTDGVTREKLFDNNFYLITEEYISGFLKYYKIDRINKKPSFIKD